VFKAESIRDTFSSFPNLESILILVKERQKMMKDSWLTAVGHKRPGMNTGLPLNEALNKSEILENKIQKLLN
jgi:hypothetical protein